MDLKNQTFAEKTGEKTDEEEGTRSSKWNAPVFKTEAKYCLIRLTFAYKLPYLVSLLTQNELEITANVRFQKV